MNELLLFAAAFVHVFALGVQQLNVSGRHYWLAFLTSFPIGISFLVGVQNIPAAGWPERIAFLLGGAAGIVVAMWIHPHMVAWFRRRS